MQVRELVEILMNMPQGAMICIGDKPVLAVNTDPNKRIITLSDHLYEKQVRTVTAFDGSIYEVPW
jgi:hypothetical protein